jgi:hypothetical protein
MKYTLFLFSVFVLGYLLFPVQGVDPSAQVSRAFIGSGFITLLLGVITWSLF